MIGFILSPITTPVLSRVCHQKKQNEELNGMVATCVVGMVVRVWVMVRLP